MSEQGWIGKSVKRVEDYRLLTGRGTYIDDHPPVANLFHAAIVRSPHAHVVKVDVIVRKDTEYRRTEFARRRRAVVEGDVFFIVAPEDLIISKLDWARDSRSEIQLADVRNMLAADPGLDREYLVRWVNRLGLDSLYREVAG